MCTNVSSIPTVVYSCVPEQEWVATLKMKNLVVMAATCIMYLAKDKYLLIETAKSR